MLSSGTRLPGHSDHQPPDGGPGLLLPAIPLPAPSPPAGPEGAQPALQGREEFTWTGRSGSPGAVLCGPPGACGPGGAEGQPDTARASILCQPPEEIAQASHPNLYGSGDFLRFARILNRNSHLYLLLI